MYYKDWLNEWLGSYVKIVAKSKTYERYEEIVRLQIAPCLGDCEIDAIDSVSLQHFVSRLSLVGNAKTGEGLSASSVNGVITVLQTSLRAAQEAGVSKSYHGDKVKRPKMRAGKTECFTVSEQRAIEQYVVSSRRPRLYGVIICLYTGIRIGELLALKWSDIDFGNMMMFIDKTCHSGRDKDGRFTLITDAPKTESSRRAIPIPCRLTSMLCDMRDGATSEHIIASSTGDRVAVRSYQRSFERILSALGVRRRGFHSLRHTFATRALERGMDVRTLSEVLGHKNPSVTLDRYAHSLLEHKREMMNRLGEIYKY